MHEPLMVVPLSAPEDSLSPPNGPGTALALAVGLPGKGVVGAVRAGGVRPSLTAAARLACPASIQRVYSMVYSGVRLDGSV